MAENANELSVQSGQIVRMMKSITVDWVVVKNEAGESGMVPSNYICELKDTPEESKKDAFKSSENPKPVVEDPTVLFIF